MNESDEKHHCSIFRLINEIIDSPSIFIYWQCLQQEILKLVNSSK
jgi:hypothetical protein